MDGFQAERNYRFSVKVISGSGTTEETINYYDDNYEFRVVR
jgi:glucose-6-phosphate isomerase